MILIDIPENNHIAKESEMNFVWIQRRQTEMN